MKSIIIVLLVFLLSGVSYATGPMVCFQQKDAAKIVVDLSNCKIIEKELNIQEQKNIELNSKIETQEKIISETEKKFEACSDTLNKTETLMKQKDKVCKDAKPSLITIIGSFLGCFGLGLLLGVLL